MMKKKNKKRSLAEKEKLVKLFIKHKKKYDNQGKVEKYSGNFTHVDISLVYLWHSFFVQDLDL